MIFTCEQCGLRQRIEPDEFPLDCVCGARHELPKPSGAGLLRRVVHYACAVCRHAGTGMPVRSDEEVERILEEHCRPCRYFDGRLCNHARCGCRVNDGRSALANKVRMATQSCPIGLWGPAARPRGRVRVLFVTPNLKSAGAERWVASMTHACDPNVVRAQGVVLVGDGRGADASLLSEVRSTCPVFTNGAAPRDVLVDTDLVVTWGAPVLPPALRSMSGRTVFVNHASTEKSAEFGLRAIEAGIGHFAAVSDAAAAFMPKPCAVLRNGVDLERCAPRRGRRAVRRRWGVDRDAVCVGFVGRPHPDKRPEAALLACSRLGEDHRAVYVGRLSASDRATIGMAGRRPVFAGYAPRIGDALVGLDCLILASRHEAMSLSVCEAWAAGVPVVATPVGAIPELERLHGKLCERVHVDADAGELAQAVWLATRPDNAAVVDRAARVVHNHYSTAAMGRRWTTYLLAVQRSTKEFDNG